MLKADGTPHEPAIKLLYVGQASAHVRGSITGRLYQFSRPMPLQAVDPRDATLMMQTRMFRQIR